jgi:hypothetical protein
MSEGTPIASGAPSAIRNRVFASGVSCPVGDGLVKPARHVRLASPLHGIRKISTNLTLRTKRSTGVVIAIVKLDPLTFGNGENPTFGDITGPGKL